MLTSHVALWRQPTGSGCGAGATTLRTATLALVHSTTKYRVFSWCCSAHTCLIHPDINDALRIVTGCLRPTPADNPSIFAGIQPGELRYKGATLSPACCAMEPGHLLHSVLTEWEWTASQIWTPICACCTAAHQLMWQQNQKCGVLGWSPMECGVIRQHHKTVLSSLTPALTL